MAETGLTCGFYLPLPASACFLVLTKRQSWPTALLSARANHSRIDGHLWRNDDRYLRFAGHLGTNRDPAMRGPCEAAAITPPVYIISLVFASSSSSLDPLPSSQVATSTTSLCLEFILL